MFLLQDFTVSLFHPGFFGKFVWYYEPLPFHSNIGFAAIPGFLHELGIVKNYFKVVVKYICGPSIFLCFITWVRWKLTRKNVLSLEASQHCKSLFENFFHAACPRYKLQWIPQHPSMAYGTPLLVVFRSLSRLQDEVDATLEKVTYADNIMLIVMHNCEPSMRPTKLLRRCEDNRVISFTNILTWNGSIYSCSINDTAKSDIRLYLKHNQQ